jgi:hypothetical protein
MPHRTCWWHKRNSDWQNGWVLDLRLDDRKPPMQHERRPSTATSRRSLRLPRPLCLISHRSRVRRTLQAGSNLPLLSQFQAALPAKLPVNAARLTHHAADPLTNALIELRLPGDKREAKAFGRA